jgi:hypothetical protein
LRALSPDNGETNIRRRDLISGASALVAGAVTATGTRAALPSVARNRAGAVSAAEFGAVGDGVADDTKALQTALDRTLGVGRPVFLVIPPGTYRVTGGLRLDLDPRRAGKLTRWSGVSAVGAQIRSAISDGSDILSINSRTLTRYFLIEGLGIYGNGRDGVGISIACDGKGHYFYNTALRDVTVEHCGGDGLRMIGNIFESQIFNSYFRDNRGNGATMSHGTDGGILSAIHVFGCVFGGNRQHGVVLTKQARDVSFVGCYFLLNKRYGLVASTGCPLLAHCGFENNHDGAPNFGHGGAGMKLNVSGTLIGCTAYSIRYQTHLVDAFITNRMVMIGCTGSGGQAARKAGLARIDGRNHPDITLIGCEGRVDNQHGFEALEVGQRGGVRFGARWNSGNQLRLGDNSLWVDKTGKLRIKRGRPSRDTDGSIVGG